MTQSEPFMMLRALPTHSPAQGPNQPLRQELHVAGNNDHVDHNLEFTCCFDLRLGNGDRQQPPAIILINSAQAQCSAPCQR